MATDLETFNEASERIGDVSRELRFLASAFERTGNEIISVDLGRFAHKLELSIKEIREMYTNELNRGYRQAVDHSGSILKTVLSGTIIGKEHD